MLNVWQNFKTCFCFSNAKTLLKYQLSKRIFKCGTTANTFFKTNHKTLFKIPNTLKKYNHTLIFSGLNVACYIYIKEKKKWWLAWWQPKLSGGPVVVADANIIS